MWFFNLFEWCWSLQEFWGGFSADGRQSSVSISAVIQMRINQLTNWQGELGEGRKHTQRPCSKTTIEPRLCAQENFTRGFSSVGAQEKKIGILELCYWLCQKITVRRQEKKFNPIVKKAVSRVVFLLCFSYEQLLLCCTNMIAAFSVTTASTASHVSKHE